MRFLRNILIGLGAYGVLWSLFLAFGWNSSGASQLQARLDFAIRNALGRSPNLDSRLKVLVFDDTAIDRLRFPELSITAWSKLLDSLAKRKPAKVFIDKQFRMIRKNRELIAFQSALKNFPKVYVGASARPLSEGALLSIYKRLDETRTEYAAQRFLGSFKMPVWLSPEVYLGSGPDPDVQPLFKGVGHINYDHIGRIQPFLKLAERKLLPHLGLFAADELYIRKNRIQVDKTVVDVDRAGLIPVNFLSLDTMRGLTESILPYYVKSFKDQPLTSIHEGDVVVILPLLYTGGVDIEPTPIGRVPHGYVLVSIINSVLSGQWIRSLPFLRLGILVCVLVGSLFGFFLSPLWFFIGFGVVVVGIFSFATFLFSWLSVQAPWVVWILSFGFSAIVFFALKVMGQYRVSKAYEMALTGLVSRSEIRSIVKNPSMLLREASEKHLSVMFIDMVGFSRLTELEDPQVVFTRLKESLALFAQTVHRYGGVVDKTLGDGMLCFFGYNIASGGESDFHADQAIRCALAIQREYVYVTFNKTLVAPVIPLRIGINSAKVLIGDLGDQDRVDFTLIGDGVNFAQRLESACDPFSILVAASCLELSALFSVDSEMVRERRIKIKHHDNLVGVYEISPFFDVPKVLEQARQLFYHTRGQAYREPRLPVRDNIEVVAHIGDTLGSLVNFSRTGFAFRTLHSLSIGKSVPVMFRGANQDFQQIIERAKLPIILGEVRWITTDGDGFLCGVKILHLSQEDVDTVFELLKKIALV
ncbi:MAG: CHASE2 domain-containing protein [Zetaproteobacteria bacterium]|nr:CHASE2 domain-containing protein [Zetaproteobacteria bacterium]